MNNFFSILQEAWEVVTFDYSLSLVSFLIFFYLGFNCQIPFIPITKKVGIIHLAALQFVQNTGLQAISLAFFPISSPTSLSQ